MGLFARLIRGVVNEVADDAVRTMSRDQYIENIYEMVPTLKKVNPINLAEIALRSAKGTPISRPLGS